MKPRRSGRHTRRPNSQGRSHRHHHPPAAETSTNRHDRRVRQTPPTRPETSEGRQSERLRRREPEAEGHRHRHPNRHHRRRHREGQTPHESPPSEKRPRLDVAIEDAAPERPTRARQPAVEDLVEGGEESFREETREADENYDEEEPMAPPEEASDHEEENYPTFPPDEEENQDCNQALALEDSNQTLALEEDNHQTANNQEDDSSSSAVPLSIAPPPTTAHRTPTVSTRDFMQELELALRRRRQRIQDAEYGGPSDPQRSTEEQHDNKHDGTNEGMTGGQDNLMTTTARISQWTSMRLHQGGSFKRGTEGGSSTMETQEKVRTGENEQVDEESRWRHPYLAHLEECPTPAYQSSAASGTPTPVTPPIRTVRDVMRDLQERSQASPGTQLRRWRQRDVEDMQRALLQAEIQRKVKRQLTEPSTNPTGRDPRHPRAPYTLLGDIIPNGRQLVRPPAPVSSTSPSSTPESQHSSRRISLPQLLFGIGGHGMTRRRRNSNERRTRRMRWRNGRQADRGRTGEETAVVTESASQTTDQSQTASSSYWFWLPIPDWFRLRFRGSGGREVSSSDSQLNRGDVQGTGDHQTTNEDEETPREGSNTPTDSSNHTDH